MNVGISVPLPAYLVDVGFMARKVEELGFESFWCAEHPFVPVRSATPFPGSADGVIPEVYAHFIDPFVALARASGVTSRIKLETGIVLVPERPPALAKEVITISVYGQPADRDLIKRLIDAGANRVVVRPDSVKTESEMGA